MPAYYAVPVVTHLLWMAPFMITAFYLFFAGKRNEALLTAAILLFLPIEYHMVTSLPRGFVTGLFFCSLYIISVHQPFSQKWIHINAALGTLAFFVNQNSLLATAPLFFYLFILNRKRREFYLVAITVAFTYLLSYLLLDKFYHDHPDLVVAPMRLLFSMNNFWNSVSHLDLQFAHLSFFMERKSWTLIAALLVLLCYLLRHNRPAALGLIMLFAVILFSFCFEKNIEGTSWPFYSYSRSYLGIITTLVLFTSLCQLSVNYVKYIAIGALAFTGYNLFTAKSTIESYIGDKKNHYVTVFTVKYALEAVKGYGDKCRELNAPIFFVSNRFWLNSILTFGGPALDENFPATQEVDRDRRKWIAEENSEKVIPTFMFISPLSNFDREVHLQQGSCHIQRVDDYGLFLITDNKLRTKEFVKAVKQTEAP
jgi:hypothetical protein